MRLDTLLKLYFVCFVGVGACKQSEDVAMRPSLKFATDLPPSVVNLQRAVEQYADSLPLLDQLLDTLNAYGAYKMAAEQCELALQRPATPPDYWYVSADFYRMASLYPQAITNYRNYLRLQPSNEQIALNLANAMAEAGSADCLKMTDSLAVAQPMPEVLASCHYIKGVYYNGKGQFDSARIWLDRALALNHNFDAAFMEKGFGYFDQGRLEEAFRTFETLVTLQPKQAEAHYWMGKCADAMGKTSPAIDCYQRALDLDPTIEEARVALKRLGKP